MKPRTRRRVSSLTLSVVLISLAVAVAIPLYYIVVSTFKTQSEMAKSPLGLPSSLSFDNYVAVVEKTPVFQSFLNTAIVTVFGVGFMVMIGALAAYGMIQKRSRFTSVVGMLLMVAFVIPSQATLIPLYQMEASLGLVNSLLGLIVMYLGGAVFCYFLIVGYMRKLPTEIFEAARLDGASPLRIFWAIVLPLIRPILVTVIVFQTMWVWNDFLYPNVFISSSSKRTIVLQVYNAVGQFTTNWPQFMTLTVIALIPVVIFFIFCQRWIVSGLAAGSVKG